MKPTDAIHEQQQEISSSPESTLRPQSDKGIIQIDLDREGKAVEDVEGAAGTDEAQPELEAEWKPSRSDVLIMVTLAVVSVMVSLDAMVIVTSITTIAQALGATSTQGFWIGTSYLLVVAITMPFTASLGDIFGRPQCLFTSIVLFTVGSIVCAVSHGLGTMLVGRCIQGSGGGGVIILSLVIYSDMVPLRYRPKYIGALQGGWALGTVIGPIIGGAFASPSTWRWVFYLMLPFCGTGLVFVPAFVRIKRPEATAKQMLARIDWFGGFLFISTATSFLIAVCWGGTTYAWDHWRTLTPLIFGTGGLVATGFWERYGAKHPFLQHSLFHTWSAHAIYFSAFVHGVLLYSQLYYLPLYFASVKLSSPIRTGDSMLPISVTLVPTSIIVGAVISRTGKYRWVVLCGWLLATLATGLTVIFDRGTRTAVWVTILTFLGIGHGLILNSVQAASQAVCPVGEEAAAVAMYAFLRSFGMAMGVGIGGSVFQNAMRTGLAARHLDTSIALRAETYVLELKHMADSPERRALMDAYVVGFHGVFGFIAGLSGLAFLASLFIKQFEMNRALATEHIVQGRQVQVERSAAEAGASAPDKAAVPE